jgi:predicted membrane-bound spermidine synthase
MKNKLLLLTLLEGGLVMLLETASPIVVAPVIGHSVMVWAIMLSLSVGALAIGYFLGGWFARKERDYRFLMQLFGGNALIILTGYMLLYLQNSSGTDLVSAGFSYLIISFVLIIPLILFGSSTPVIIDLLHRETKENSGTAGRMFSNSTIGGIIFSILTGYFFIDTMGVGNTILMGVVLCLLLPFFYYLSVKNNKLLGITGGAILGSFVLMATKPELPGSDDFKTLHFSEGITGQLIVVDYKQENTTMRTLLINRMGQTMMNLDSKLPSWPYMNYLTSAASVYPQGSRTLVLGLGGGIVAKQISYYLGHNVDAVELDQRIVDLSEEYFDFWQTNINVYSDDARRYVKSVDARYDFIVLDIFNGEIMPSHGLSKEAFEDIDRILKPGGLIAINFNGFLTGKEGTAGRSVIMTLKASGYNVDVFDCGAGKIKESERNVIYFAYREAPKWQNARTHTIIEGKEYRIGDNLMKKAAIPTGEAYVITDDKPVLEYINRYAAENWRKDYLKNYTKKFRKEYKLPLVY